MASSDHGLWDGFPGLIAEGDPAASGAPLRVGGDLTRALGLRCSGTPLGWEDLRARVASGDRPHLSTCESNWRVSGCGWEVEYRIDDQGQVRWLLETAVPIRLADNSPGVRLHVVDISRYKVQAAALEARAERLQHESQRKSEFFASMNHEVRTPMNGVMGMAQVLAKTHLDGEQRQFVNTIIESGRALITIINDILDFSKIEAGKLALAPEPTDMEKVAYDACQLLAARATEKNLALLLDYRHCFPRQVTVDGGRLRQVLLNLLGNAVKFTQTGHVILSVECVRIGADDADFMFKVTDTGPGIAPTARARLFKAYAQADDAVANKFGGTGLGLQISKRLVELMGGEIGVESREGLGSTFWFQVNLPVVSNTAGTCMLSLSGKRMLVVDADPLNGEILASYLRDAGADVVVLDDAEEALAHLSSGDTHYDGAIIDNGLRGIDGVKLTSLVKSSAHHAALPVVLLTSVLQPTDSRALHKAGVNAYLNKPVACNLLYRALTLLMEKSNAGDEPIFVANDGGLVDGRATGTVAIKGKVLVVDDVEVNQAVLHAMLAGCGVAVDVATNGRQALAKWGSSDYDLILMDCQMPELDGYAATRAIRSAGTEKARVPIVALTGNAGDGEREKCSAAGMDDYLTKPFIESALFEKLAKWLRVDTAAAPSAPPTAPAHAAAQALDIDRFNNLRGLMHDKFAGFVASFATSVADRYRQMVTALQAGQIAEAGDVAHALKGLAGMVGAMHVAELALRVEDAAKAGDFAAATLALPKLEKAINAATQLVNEQLHAELDQQVVLF